MPSENANVPHHAQIKNPGGLVSRRRSKEVVVDSREPGRGHRILVAVKRSQASCGARIPELDLMIFGP
jgi:hypothetical protein